MKNSLLTACILGVACAISQPALAWNATGHMIVAALAYRQLDTTAKQEVNALLKKHPEYQTWKRAFRSGSGVDLSTFVFMQASVWPDEIRRSGNPFDHPNWHFVDYPIKPPQFPVEPRPSPQDDVLFGIAQCDDVLTDTSVPLRTRAAHLSWLIHLVGDIHQPLHCASLFNNTYGLPDGDRGGNLLFVRPGQRGIKLHSFWDGLLGNATAPSSLKNSATDLAARFPATALPQLTTAVTAEAWSLESRTHAKDTAYNLTSLEGHTTAGTAVSISSSYTTAAKALAEQQIALAAYRLASQIETLFP